MSTFKERPLSVELLTFTHDPLSVFLKAWNRTRRIPIPEDPAERRAAEVECFRKLVYEYTQIPEFIKFTFWIEGLPREFYDQITRHRKTAWFTTSMRDLDMGSFGSDGNYLTTGPIAEHPEARELFHRTMLNNQMAYQKLIDMGIPIEDARGVIPISIRTDLSWTLTLRDMTDIFRSRTCHLAQMEYWGPLISEFKRLLKAVDPELLIIFQPPCERSRTCVSRVSAQERNDMAIAGDPKGLPPCRLYNEYFADPTESEKVAALVTNGKTSYAKWPEEYGSG